MDQMTELVVLRVVAVSSLFWFFVSEWMHHKQIERSYKKGFDNAIKTAVKQIEGEMNTFIREFRNDLEVLAEAVRRDEQSESTDAERTGKT